MSSVVYQMKCTSAQEISRIAGEFSRLSRRENGERVA